MPDEATAGNPPAPTATPPEQPAAPQPTPAAPVVATPPAPAPTKPKNKNKPAKTDYRAELEKLKTDMTAEINAVKAQAEQTRLNSIKAAVLIEAKQRGFIYPDDVLGKVDLAGLELTENGVKGLGKALDDVAKARPSWLQPAEVSKPAEPQKPAGRGWFGGGKAHDDGASKPPVKLNKGLVL